jgi:predicted aldo/keto reductase-like oxidoreductase
MGRSGVQISALSMGCGHLPDDPDTCDELLRAAVAAGINYFETATSYCNGECQQRTGRGLEPVRDHVMISAKHGLLVEGEAEGYPPTTGDDYRREILEKQLPALRTDHVEWLQVGWFQAYKLEALRTSGVLDAIRRLQDEKIVGHVGFTTHDTPENVVTCIESGEFESCTLQYNLLNRSYEPAVDAAGEHGVAIVVMGPLHGGMLALPAPALRELVPNPDVTTTRAGLQFVLSHPAISTACSGMSSLTQLAENLASVLAEPTDADRVEMDAVFARFQKVADSLCTGCNYCAPCPQGVNISQNLRLRNYLAVYGAIDAAAQAYAGIEPAARAACCSGCGECEPKCPNNLPVRRLLAEIAEACEPLV